MQIKKVKNLSYTNTSELWKSSRREACFEAALQLSAVRLNRAKARIKPLFEFNRTAASVASSNNGMPTFFNSIHTKKFLQNVGGRTKLHAYSKKKNFIGIKVLKKEIHD